MANSNRNVVIVLFAIFGLFAVGAAIAILSSSGGISLPSSGGRVAVIPLRGVIADERGFTGTLDEFRGDGSVRGFVIEIESPGGTVGASQAVFSAIRSLRDEDERPVLAWMGDVGASGGYYAAVGADSIYALPGTITGSIGVIMEFPNAEELFRKAGVEWEVITSGPHKDMGSFSRELAPSERRILQELVEDVHEQFVEVVAENRGMDWQSAMELADGRIYSGRQARELGLVDGLMTLDETIAQAGRMAGLGSNPAVVRPRPRSRGVLDFLDFVGSLLSGEATGVLGRLSPIGPGSPRILYEWR